MIGVHPASGVRGPGHSRHPARFGRRPCPAGPWGIACLLALAGVGWGAAPAVSEPGELWRELPRWERERVLLAADRYLAESPLTITASFCERSAGGRHDFYSEGDYWWPDPEHPDGPYVRRDGMSNPENFADHRRALVRFGIQAPALVAAYRITRDRRYADHAVKHLRAWFINPDTAMRPALEYAQAISGRVTGRGVGIIDTIHLVEVALAARILVEDHILAAADAAAIRAWFSDYLHWMTTHAYGLDEMNRLNNHGTCWLLQVAAFSTLTGNDRLLDACRERFRTVVLPHQLAADGRFPLELERTKPYGYALFNLDVMSGVIHLLSTPTDNLWTFRVENGAGFRDAVAYMAPFVKNKSSWPLPPDVMYWDQWPVRHPSLLFAGIAYQQPEWVGLWKTLDPDPATEEVIRNFPIRQPVLWYLDRDQPGPGDGPGDRARAP